MGTTPGVKPNEVQGHVPAAEAVDVEARLPERLAPAVRRHGLVVLDDLDAERLSVGNVISYFCNGAGAPMPSEERAP